MLVLISSKRNGKNDFPVPMAVSTTEKRNLELPSPRLPLSSPTAPPKSNLEHLVICYNSTLFYLNYFLLCFRFRCREDFKGKLTLPQERAKQNKTIKFRAMWPRWCAISLACSTREKRYLPFYFLNVIDWLRRISAKILNFLWSEFGATVVLK